MTHIDDIFSNLPKLFIKVDGLWHQANARQSATLCGLDPQDAQDVREHRLPSGANFCPTCEASSNK